MKSDESVINVIIFYDELINECLNAIKATFEVIRLTDEGDTSAIQACNSVLAELEKKLEGYLNMRKLVIGQIHEKSNDYEQVV